MLDDVCLGLVKGLSPDWVSRHRGHVASAPSEFEKKQIKTATSFGNEWEYFSEYLPDYESLARVYFDLLEPLDFSGVTLDAGCGTGRWAKYVAGRGRVLLAADLSTSVEVAARTLAGLPNTHVLQADVHRLPFHHGIFDLIYSLGVLHHLPDPQEGLKQVVRHLKEKGRFLGYFYYAFDNRPRFYHALIPLVSALRWCISRLPQKLARAACLAIACCVYWPLIQLGLFLQSLGLRRAARQVPLFEFYGDKSFSILFNDSVDRFATAIEFRFSRERLEAMLSEAGLSETKFSATLPFWKLTGIRSPRIESASGGHEKVMIGDGSRLGTQVIGNPVRQVH